MNPIQEFLFALCPYLPAPHDEEVEIVLPRGVFFAMQRDLASTRRYESGGQFVDEFTVYAAGITAKVTPSRKPFKEAP